MVMEIPLSRGMVALVDDEDYERLVTAGPWHAVPGKHTFYARHTTRRDGVYRNIFMHTLVAGFSSPDHINLDGLDNRRANLRAATASQQCQNRRLRVDNRTGFVGVRRRDSGRWGALVRVNGSTMHLGTYATAEQAARVRDAAALAHYGEFARLNFPLENAS